MQWLRRRFIAGFFVTVPLFITVAAIVWLFGVVDGLTTPLYDRLLGRHIPGLGLVTTGAAIVLVGAVANNLIGKRLLQRVESYLLRLPVFRRSPPSNSSSRVFTRQQSGFKRVFLIEPIRLLAGVADQGIHRIGERPGIARRRLCAHQSSVSGRHRDLRARPCGVPDYQVEEGIRIFLTGGMALPSRLLGLRDEDRAQEFRI